MAAENRLIDKIKEWVAERNGKVIKIHQSGFSELGIPDLIIILKAGTFFVETKTHGKKPKPIQLYRIKEINEAGGHAFWTDNFKNFIEKITLAGDFLSKIQ